jgi:hypothetical protein
MIASMTHNEVETGVVRQLRSESFGLFGSRVLIRVDPALQAKTSVTLIGVLSDLDPDCCSASEGTSRGVV